MKPPPTPRSSRNSPLVATLALALCLLTGWIGYRAALAVNLESQRKAASQRLDFYAVSLEAALARYESLPWLLALERGLGALLEQRADPALRRQANHYLETAQRDAGIAAAYLIAPDGETLAASNWNQPLSFVGQNYGVRPYFRTALTGKLGRYFGIGITTGEPAYFLAAPVHGPDGARGAVAIKVSLNAFEQALANSGDKVLLADANGVIFLSSQTAWKYRTLAPLGADARRRINEERQYGDQPLPLLATQENLNADTALLRSALPGMPPGRLLLQARPVGQLGWRLVLLANPEDAERGAAGVGVAAGFATAFALALAVYLRLRQRRREELRLSDLALRRAHAELEQRIAERTADLTAKVAALKSAEAILRETRDSAVQAGKLAVLGQMAAGISHEINQPLAALHTLSDNAAALIDRGRVADARENLVLISQMIGRTGRIIAQLKAFARKGPEQRVAVALDEAIEHALLMVEPRRRELGATLEVRPPRSALRIHADAVRIEQVLVNLIRNGLDAMAGQAGPKLVISTQAADGRVAITLRDHGPGIAPEVLPHLFEPFYTTKPVGEGLGLGLAISVAIVEGFGGRIEARNADGGGAEFVVTLDQSAPAV